jgi:hypothetical protein
MKEIVITIAGKDYTVQPLKFKGSRSWRMALAEKFDGIVDALQGVGMVEVKDMAGIGRIIDELKGTLIGSLDTVLDLVCAYVPAISEDRARIEEEAFDEEIIDAFTRILGLAFPLGKILGAMNGLTASTTSRS